MFVPNAKRLKLAQSLLLQPDPLMDDCYKPIVEINRTSLFSLTA